MLLLDFVIFKQEYKQDKTKVKITKIINVLLLFLKTYAIEFFTTRKLNSFLNIVDN